MLRRLFVGAALSCAAATYIAADEPHVLASADHEAGGVKVELLEVKRDSPTVVTVRWRYRNETDEPKQLTKQRTGSIDAYRLALNSYLLDQTKQIKYPLSRDTDREPVASRNGEPNKYITIGPKATINVWAKYIVPENTKKVAVAIEGVSPFEDIEISH
jgi:hypothetical protein